MSLSEFVSRSAEWDRMVRRETELAQFCSQSAWLLSALRGLHNRGDETDYLILRDETTSDGCWIALFRQDPGIFFPMESAWMFGRPLLGEPEGCFDLLRYAAREIQKTPTGFVIPGLLQGGRWHQYLQSRAEECSQFQEFESTQCMMIDLQDGGVDAWLQRRSKRFRKTLQQSHLPPHCLIRDASLEPPEQLWERIFDIQKQTYKWKEDTDIFLGEEYRRFYRELLEQVSIRRQLRILFAEVEKRDAAYIFGAVSGEVYRGFQMSYTEEFRSYGLGNQLQYINLKQRGEEGVLHYDLGMHSLYKERWVDRREEYVGLFFVL